MSRHEAGRTSTVASVANARAIRRTLGIALLLVSTVFAGCLTGTDPLPTITLDTLSTRPAGAFTWPAPVATDAEGNLLASHALLDSPDTLPVLVQQMVPGGGAEPNVGVTRDGGILVTTLDQVQKSMDHGRTWNVVHNLASPNAPVTEDRFSTADPMAWVDPVTGRAYANHMHPALLCTYLAWSDDDGATWTDRPMACATPYLDHQKIMTALPGPATLPVSPAGVAWPTVFYLCVNKIEYGTWCATSYDGGATFAHDMQIRPQDPGCASINGHPAAYPDGTVVVPLGNLGSGCRRPLTVVVTEDNGLTWTSRQCNPDIGQVEIDADITVTPDGTAYMLYRDHDQRAHLLRSTDKFLTCDVFPVTPPDHTMSVFTAIASGDDGRIAMAYLGTRDAQDAGTTPSHVVPGTVWHLYATYSMDADTESPTFLTMQVTPNEDPVQVGCVWLEGGTGGPYQCRNMLDFIDAVADAEGRFIVTFTDGCSLRNGCGPEPDGQVDYQSRDHETAVAVTDRGMSLFAEQGVLAAVGLEHPPAPARTSEGKPVGSG